MKASTRNQFYWTRLITVVTATLLTACGGGGSDGAIGADASASPVISSPDTPVVTIPDVPVVIVPPADTTPPTVLSFAPASALTGVRLNSVITVKFSEAMDPATITKGNLHVSNDAHLQLSGDLVFDAATNTATFAPEQGVTAGVATTGMVANTRYHITVMSAVKDLAGNAMPPLPGSGDAFVSFFTTGTAI